MTEYERLIVQMNDCGECLESFLVQIVDKQPEFEEHAGIVRDHLERCDESLRCLPDGL